MKHIGIIFFILLHASNAMSLPQCKKLTENNIPPLSEEDKIIFKSYTSKNEARKMTTAAANYFTGHTNYNCRYLSKDSFGTTIYFFYRSASSTKFESFAKQHGLQILDKGLFIRLNAMAQIQNFNMNQSPAALEFYEIIKSRTDQCVEFVKDGNNEAYRINFEDNKYNKLVVSKKRSDQSIKVLSTILIDKTEAQLRWDKIFHYEREENEIKEINDAQLRIKNWSIVKDISFPNSYALFFEDESMGLRERANDLQFYSKISYLVRINIEDDESLSFQFLKFKKDLPVSNEGIFKEVPCSN
ncbi:MAG: hypothetical protein QE271_12840 [Bacteriovoracaceae bacterium]|nr:hypothetical protein [Bacteriovoracaceae bacterium]